MNTPDDGNLPRLIIGGTIALGIVFLAAALFFTTPTAAAQQVLTGLLSALTLGLGQVIQFYFGSSAGGKVLAANQSDTVKTLATAVANSAPIGAALGDQPKGTPDDPVSVKEAPPKQEDPELVKFKKMAKLANPSATDDQITAAWGNLKGVDVSV